LTGVRPFVGESMATVAHLIVYGPRPSARAANAALPPGADQVLERALSRFPAKRFPNCTQFALALETALQNAKQPQKRTVPPVLYIGALALFMVVAVVFVAVHYKKQPQAEAKPAPVAVAVSKPIPPPAAPVPATPVPVASVAVAPVSVAPASAPLPAAEKPKVIPAQLYKTAVELHRQGKPEQARTLFQQAADLGNTDAMVELAETYSTSAADALRWFQKAADAGNSQAMLSLGGLYLVGSDAVAQSDEEAARWFQKAVDKKNPSGMYNLAGLYEEGRGVPRDAEKAKQLYREAAALGNTLAETRLTEMGAK
jgi:tetratricopeptide (TPR) repeat protein